MEVLEGQRASKMLKNDFEPSESHSYSHVSSLTEEEILQNSDQLSLQDYASMGSNVPKYAQGLFDEPPGPGMRRKRRKLAEFSEDEKQARRKLKNRIAAQTARDRKRIETEMQCSQLHDLKKDSNRWRTDNESLRSDNASLREDNARLREENARLRDQLSYVDIQKKQSREISIKPENPINDVEYLNREYKVTNRSDNFSTTPLVSKVCTDPQICMAVNPVNIDAKATAERLPMPLRVCSPNMAVIQTKETNTVNKKNHQSTNQPTISYHQMQAFYTILLSTILQLAWKVVHKTQSRGISTLTGVPTTTTEEQEGTQYNSKSLMSRLKLADQITKLKQFQKAYRNRTDRTNDPNYQSRLSNLPLLSPAGFFQPTNRLMNLLGAHQNETTALLGKVSSHPSDQTKTNSLTISSKESLNPMEQPMETEKSTISSTDSVPPYPSTQLLTTKPSQYSNPSDLSHPPLTNPKQTCPLHQNIINPQCLACGTTVNNLSPGTVRALNMAIMILKTWDTRATQIKELRKRKINLVQLQTQTINPETTPSRPHSHRFTQIRPPMPP